MKTLEWNLEPRRTSLAVIGATAIIFVAICNYMILPAYDEWGSLRQSVAGQQLRFEKLTRNLSVKQSVDDQFAKLGREVMQVDSDQARYSEFLRRLEIQARQAEVSIINIKPFEVNTASTQKIYRVRLSVAGKIQKLVKFIDGLSQGPDVVGTESLKLRAVQGVNMAECTLSIWMVRLTTDTSVDIGAGLSAAASRKEPAGAS